MPRFEQEDWDERLKNEERNENSIIWLDSDVLESNFADEFNDQTLRVSILEDWWDDVTFSFFFIYNPLARLIVSASGHRKDKSDIECYYPNPSPSG